MTFSQARQGLFWFVRAGSAILALLLPAVSAYGRADGILAAYRASDGKEVWSFNTGTGIMAPPITYTIDGIQHISILAGFGGGPGLINPPGSGPVKPGFGRILTFAIGRAAPFNPLPFGHKDLPHPASEVEVPARVVHEGELLYGFNGSPCHGVNAIAGALPDLRYAGKQTLDEIESIVLGGSRAADGMPSFAKLLSAGQVRSIRAFLVSRARESAKSGDVRR